jgi:hypothetical protein
MLRTRGVFLDDEELYVLRLVENGSVTMRRQSDRPEEGRAL